MKVFNKNEKTNYLKKVVVGSDISSNTDKDDDYNKYYFYLSHGIDEPEKDSIVSVYIQKNYAYIFCFYGNCFNEKNVVAPKAIDSDYNILFFNVTYEAAIVILKDIGFSKIKEDSVDFGVIFEEDLQHNMASIYREYWKRIR